MATESIRTIKLIPGGQSIGIKNKVKNQILGIGTITFIEPSLYKYGAIGHILTFFNKTHQKNSCMISSIVKEIKRSKKGEPGTKIGSFLEHIELGSIEKNTNDGIFGRVKGPITNPYFKEPIPIARFEEVEAGAAKMYTVVDGDLIEEFNVRISTTKTTLKKMYDLEIELNDPDLFQRTGGFVKGMSGSPIVQNGRLIGAFSHISLTDSLHGFGLLAERMLTNLYTRERYFSFKHLTKALGLPAIGRRNG